MYTTAEELHNASTRYAKRISNIAYTIVDGEAIPIPSLVSRTPGKWTIKKSSSAHVDVIGKVLVVPFGNVAAARAIRIEELLHIRHSPVRDKKFLAKLPKLKVRDDFLQGAEDFRVKKIAYDGTFYRDKRFIKGIKQTAKLAKRTILSNPPDILAGLTGNCPFPFSTIAYSAMAVYPIERGDIFCSLVDTYIKQHELENFFKDKSDPKKFNKKLFDILFEANYSSYWKDKKSNFKNLSKGVKKLATSIEELVSFYELRNLLPAPPPEKTEKEKLEKHDVYSGSITSTILDSISNPFEIINLPLTRRLLFNLKTRTVSQQGFSIRRIENLHLDPFYPPIFAARIHQKSRCPVILLDASGSMCPSSKEIIQVIKHAPGATIAYYSGESNWDGTYGKIVVVSQKGYFCDEKRFSEHFMGNNIIDWPAINWAINTHPGRPIYWITDQGYTWKDTKGFNAKECNVAITSYMRAKGVKFFESVKSFLQHPLTVKK